MAPDVFHTLAILSGLVRDVIDTDFLAQNGITDTELLFLFYVLNHNYYAFFFGALGGGGGLYLFYFYSLYFIPAIGPKRASSLRFPFKRLKRENRTKE